MEFSIVIPCYKSSQSIRQVVSEIDRTMAARDVENYEIIMVNDCSPDNTWDVIKELIEEDPRRIAINLAKNVGQHAALMAGFNHASGDLVATCDDDLQTPFEEFWKLKEKIDQGFDVATSKYTFREGQGIKRKIGSTMDRLMKKWLIDSPEGVSVSVFLLAKKYVIDEIVKYKNPYPYLSGLVFRTTFNIENVEMTQRRRTYGESGYSFRKLLSLWMNGFTAFSIKPLRVADILGIILSAAGFIYGIVLVIRKIMNPNILAGWSSLTCILLIIGGIIMVMLGLIGEYIGRIYICINQTPQYVVKDIVRANGESYD